MKTNKYLSFLVVVSFIVTSAMAQEERRIAINTPVPCPHPIGITLTAPPPPPTRDPADFTGTLATATNGSVWNQTQVNKGFGHSFHFVHPGKGECCLMTKGTLTVWVKALQGGPKGGASSSNDWVQLVQHGQSVPGSGQQPFASFANVTAGQTATVTINVPASILATGTVSFYVQDDSAVLRAELKLEGCCLR